MIDGSQQGRGAGRRTRVPLRSGGRTEGGLGRAVGTGNPLMGLDWEHRESMSQRVGELWFPGSVLNWWRSDGLLNRSPAVRGCLAIGRQRRTRPRLRSDHIWGHLVPFQSARQERHLFFNYFGDRPKNRQQIRSLTGVIETSSGWGGNSWAHCHAGVGGFVAVCPVFSHFADKLHHIHP